MQQITSKDNQYIKLARSLHSKKHRLQQGCTLVEGVRLAEEAAAAADCRYALFTDAALAEPRAAALAESLQQRGVACLQVTQRLLDGVSDTEHASGVLLVVNIAPQTMPAPSGYYYAYCDNISDPGNLGAIMRNAYAAGCSGLFL
ncbi:MAG: hypothetical protein IJN59_03805, partial [Oscillospiraceae bacterium]|nr:hypothetical protein [Oscillospiraceae bacterium]